MRRVPDNRTTNDELAALYSEQIQADHHYYEEMARRVDNPGDIGCWTGARDISISEDELIVNVYRPCPTAVGLKPPVIAFGNTHFYPSDPSVEAIAQALTDLLADVDAMEIGAFRFAINEGRIRHLIVSLQEEYGSRVVLTGHSLGGAIAQVVACHYWSNTKAVVTFQAPRIGRSYLLLANVQHDYDTYTGVARNSYHYIMDGDDIVSNAGHVHTPGFTVRFYFAPSYFDELVAELIALIAEDPITREIIETVGSAVSNLYQNVVAHINDFFDEYYGGRNLPPQGRQIRREYDRITLDIANRNAATQDHTIDWLRTRLGPAALAALIAAVGALPSGGGTAIGLPYIIGATEAATMQRSVYVMVWEYVRLTVKRTRRYPTTLQRLRFPLSLVMPGNALGAVDAHRLVTDYQMHVMRCNIAWLYPAVHQEGGCGPVVAVAGGRRRPAPVREIEPLMDAAETLTEEGVDFLQERFTRGRHVASSLERGAIIRLFIGQNEDGERGERNTDAVWREAVVIEETKRYYDVALAYVFNDGIIRLVHTSGTDEDGRPVVRTDGTGRPMSVDGSEAEADRPSRTNLQRRQTEVYYSEAGGERVLIMANRGMGIVLDVMKRAQAIPVDNDALRLNNGVWGSVRDWSVAQFLVYALRGAHDQALLKAYFVCHAHFLNRGANRADPLNFISPEDQARYFCVSQVRPFTLRNFRREAFADSDNSADPSLIVGAREWYDFLFKMSPRGAGFMATCYPQSGPGRGTLRPPLENCLQSTGTNCPDLEPATGLYALKRVSAKQPDLIIMHLDQRRIEVVDISFRWDVPWHNFKTALYASVLRQVLPDDWTVTSLDYRSVNHLR